jgi:hypothetical protein
MVATSPRNPNIFVNDLGKLYMKRRRATQAKGVETLDPKAEVEGPSESLRESPHPVQRKINLNCHPRENNRNRSARSSYAPWTSLI